MTTNFSFLKTHSSFREAVLYFHQSKVGILPVVDEQNQLVGAITRYSVFRALLEDISLDSAVFTHMIREPVTLFEEMKLNRVSIHNKKLLLTAKTISHEEHPWGSLLILQDLTDYETIASELEMTKSLKQKLQTVVDAAYDGLILIDQQGKIEIVNHAISELVSCPKEDLIGQEIDLFFRTSS
ncbi:CBS domain-containing protein [Brevibacillus invocatus]|uniref:CBS domain-containing protein n=1 Tax=Brevibacillus invocatus TaxID=173959 RepID=UPI002040B6C1|nr:CBS domain-containing protein [Brevibacillus invocatus]MCM3081597.1 CBS domain-containing protein [Brevibacillus invocatus]MCM3431972.1 CBS domain-containing protein [Brevibacillus invocatus]